jgi:O-antigen ligase
MQGIYATMDVLVAFYLVARFGPQRRMELFLLLGWVVTVSSIFAALVFPQYGQQHQAAVGAWIGIFVEKNNCSVMVAFLLSVAFYIRLSSSFFGFLRALYVCLSLALIVMSQARTGWIIAVCLILYVALTKYLIRYKARDRALIGVSALGACVIACIALATYYTAITRLVGKDPTMTGRTSIWSLAFASAMKRPILGYGYRAF